MKTKLIRYCSPRCRGFKKANRYARVLQTTRKLFLFDDIEESKEYEEAIKDIHREFVSAKIVLKWTRKSDSMTIIT